MERIPFHLQESFLPLETLSRGDALVNGRVAVEQPLYDLRGVLVGEVLRVMRQLADEGRTMLVVTHEMGFARGVSSRVLFLHQGQVEEEGPPEQVFSAPRSDRFRQFVSGLHA